MTTLKEKIENRKNSRNELANDYATRQVSFYHCLCSDEFKAGYDSAMKEVLPILLECVEALEKASNNVTWWGRAHDPDDGDEVLFTYGMHIEQCQRALERLRKWSEGNGNCR